MSDEAGQMREMAAKAADQRFIMKQRLYLDAGRDKDRAVMQVHLAASREAHDIAAAIRALPLPSPPTEPRPDPVAALREKIKAEIARLWEIALAKAKGSSAEHAEGMAMLRNISALEWVLTLMADPGGDAAGGGA